MYIYVPKQDSTHIYNMSLCLAPVDSGWCDSPCDAPWPWMPWGEGINCAMFIGCFFYLWSMSTLNMLHVPNYAMKSVKQSDWW